MAGFIAHMIASLKTNKRSRVSTFDKIKDFKKSKKSQLVFPNKATPRELKKLRNKMQQQNDVQFFKKVGIIIILIITLLYIISLDNY